MRRLRRQPPVDRSTPECYARSISRKACSELAQLGYLITVTYLLLGNEFITVPMFYRTEFEKQLWTASVVS